LGRRTRAKQTRQVQAGNEQQARDGAKDHVERGSDTRHQITVAVTPDFTNNPDAPVNALVDKAICS